MREYKSGTIVTYTGRFVDPTNLKPEDVYLPDIAHALSMKCRFLGQARYYYSHAQHCCLMAMYAKGMSNFQAIHLLHDASKAYWLDLPKPSKHDQRFTECKNVENEIEATIFDKYVPKWRSVFLNGGEGYKPLNHQLLINECRQLLTNWELIPVANELPLLHIPIEPWTWQEAERTFLALAAVLGIKD